MKTTRFFVTAALILGTAAFVACNRKTDKRTSQFQEGNQQIQAAAGAQSDLAAQFKISLDSASGFNWNSLSKDQRQSAKEKLAGYVSAVTRTFEIDAKKGLYITKKEVLQQQLNQAMSLQKSLENFESVYGENFEPKKLEDQNPKDHA
jgi:hypothetical protein